MKLFGYVFQRYVKSNGDYAELADRLNRWRSPGSPGFHDSLRVGEIEDALRDLMAQLASEKRKNEPPSS